MPGYRKKSVTENIHSEDKCPSYSAASFSEYVCAAYDGQNIYSCAGHRNVNTANKKSFASYGTGSTIQNSGEMLQYTEISTALQEEIDDRQKHEWYKTVSDFSTTAPTTGSLVDHVQENAINDSINALNNIINSKNDYGIGQKDGRVSYSKKQPGNVTYAEDLKYLERNIDMSYKDCICYSDCTQHGISSYTKKVWCSLHGGTEDDKKGFYFF